jgi:uncharacterized SAM-binding protein YcdF (DUF218 family)
VRHRHDIVCISSIDWDFIWQGHQEIMSRFAAEGHRVLFVENTGIRPPGVRDLGRVRSRVRNWWRGTRGFREERPGLFILSPLLLPLPYSRIAVWVNRTLLRRALQRWMRATSFHAPIVWTFLPTPLARAVMRDLDPALTIYYCIDDFASSSHAARQVTKAERLMFREVDLVFVTSERLRQRAARDADRVHLFPFAVNYEAFERVRLAADEVPPDLRALPKPIVGYVGGLHHWIDQPLLCAVADALPQASVVLIGPRQTDVSSLESRPNIHLLGARPHAELPGYIKGFDVGLIPYRLSEYTAHVYPTKLNEYLAMGVPVVTTDLDEIRRFAAKYGPVVESAASPDLFVSGVRRALAGSAEAVARRIEVARDNGWTARVAEMSALITTALDERSRSSVGWEARLGRLYRVARRPSLYAASALLAVYVLLFHTPLLWLSAQPLQVVDPPAPADAIVVLAGGIGESGVAGEAYQEKVLQAVELYQGGYAGHLIFSSGVTYVFREAQVMKALALALGVPEEAIVLEERGGGNYASLLNAKAIMDARGWTRVLVVTSPFNTVRSRLVASRNLPDATVRLTPPTGSAFFGNRDEVRWRHIRAIVHEYLAILYYWARGYI